MHQRLFGMFSQRCSPECPAGEGGLYRDAKWSACCGCWLPRIHVYKQKKAVRRRKTNQIKKKKVVCSVPTIGFNMETVEYRSWMYESSGSRLFASSLGSLFQYWCLLMCV